MLVLSNWEIRSRGAHAKVPRAGAPVEVLTQSAYVDVTGTNFTVHACDFEPTTVTVNRGTVIVQGRDDDFNRIGAPLSLTAGQRARVVRGFKPEIIP